MVILATSNIFIRSKKVLLWVRALGGRWWRNSVHPVCQHILDGLVGDGANRYGIAASLIDPTGTILVTETDNTKSRSVPLFRMGLCLNKMPYKKSDVIAFTLGPANHPFWSPLQVGLMRRRTVDGFSSKFPFAIGSPMRSHSFGPEEDLNDLACRSNLYFALNQLVGSAVEVVIIFNMVINIYASRFPLSIDVRL